MRFFKKKFTLDVHNKARIIISHKIKGESIFNWPLLPIFLKKLSENFLKIIKILKSSKPEIGVFILIALLAWASLQTTRIGAIALEIKDRLTQKAFLGFDNLQNAKTALRTQDLSKTEKNLQLALKNFQDSKNQLNNLNASLFGLSKLLPQSRDADHLLEASILLAQAGDIGLIFYDNLSKFSFGAAGISNETDFSALKNDFSKFMLVLEKANDELKKVNISNLPQNNREEARKSIIQIELAIKSGQTIEQLFDLGEIFFIGSKQMLLLLQNSNELRPTGGFIGTYGKTILKNGKIVDLKISSIYDLDGQLTEEIIPPSPILEVNNRLFLRDSNWFASFPDSAQLITEFYEKEGGETPDVIIALTPQAILPILDFTGPLNIADGISINRENLVEQLQILTQMSPSAPVNEPKKLISSLFTEIIQKISALNPEQRALVLQSLVQSLNNKEILFYSRESKAQKIFENFNWAGRLIKSDRDYLQISSANLGGTKTDLSISEKISLSSTITEDGKIENTVILQRNNTLPNFPGAVNKSFIRFYVPKDSQFLGAEGFDRINPPNIVQENFKTNNKIFEWEKTQVKDVVTGTLIGKESHKTFFGNWQILKGGETKTIIIKYALPFKLKHLDRMSLMLQKQPGSNQAEFEYSLNASNREVLWKNFEYNNKEKDKILANILLNKDYFFGIVLQKAN